MNWQKKLKDSGIGWTDATWNPISGCLNDCWYCYARKRYTQYGNSFEPTFKPHKVSEPIKQTRNYYKRTGKTARIFLCSVSDFWGQGVQQEWRDQIYEIIRECPDHIFQVLTKQPQNIIDTPSIPANMWVGVSVTGKDKFNYDIMYNIFQEMATTCINSVRFISFEPLLAEPPELIKGLQDWIIIGKYNGAGDGPHRPKREWVENLVKQADNLGVPIFMKKQLKAMWPGEMRQEFPTGKNTNENIESIPKKD